MSKAFEPKVTEGVHPEDGGWTGHNGRHLLLLYIPEWSDIISHPVPSFDYVWLYQKTMDAYIFCFRLADGPEKAVIFTRKHAGVLLMDIKAYEPFDVAVTAHPLKTLAEQKNFLYLPNIELERSLVAGW